MNRRKFILSLAALSVLPALSAFPSPKESETILDWLNGLPHEDNTFLTVHAGADLEEWFQETTELRKHHCIIRWVNRPWRYNLEHQFVQSTSPMYPRAQYEQIFAYAGSTIYAAIFDRETKQIVFFPDMKLC